MMSSLASPVLAQSVGPGGTAALVVFLLILACVGLFFAFVGSLRRLRGNVSKGEFHGDIPPSEMDAGRPDGVNAGQKAATRNRGGRPGAGA